jgi:aspartate racemase
MSRLVLGVLGGMGPGATSTFFQTLLARTPARGDQEHLHVLIDSDPTIPDRTAFLLGHGPDPRPSIIKAGVTLRNAGATHLVMPCNTANVFAAEVAQAVQLPVVPWLDIAVHAVAVANASPVGVLATTGSLRSKTYQRRLRESHVPYLVPDDAIQERVMEVIYGPYGVKTLGSASAHARRLMATVCANMVELGAASLLLACTELPLAMGRATCRQVVAIDPAIAVADYIVKLSEECK